jgi:hypothetical protein
LWHAPLHADFQKNQHVEGRGAKPAQKYWRVLLHAPSGGVGECIYQHTQSSFASKWLLEVENKHECTSLFDSTLITQPFTFPVIVHSVPISSTPVSELCKENNIDPKLSIL